MVFEYSALDYQNAQANEILNFFRIEIDTQVSLNSQLLLTMMEEWKDLVSAWKELILFSSVRKVIPMLQSA